MPPSNVPNSSPDLSSQLYPKRTTSVPPTLPVQPTQEPTPVSPQISNPVPAPQSLKPIKSGRKGILIIVLILIVLIGGGVAYAYQKGIGPFGNVPYSNAQLVSDIVGGLGKINNATYSLSLNMLSEPKDADAESFSVAVPVDAEKVAAYNRDSDKVRDVQQILSKLSEYKYRNKAYPASLSRLDRIPGNANQDYVYVPKQNLSGYALSFSVETSDAADAIAQLDKYSSEKSIIVKDKKVTLTDSSYQYIYIPAEPRKPAIVDLLNMQSYLSYIPANFKFEGSLSGASQRIDEKNVNGQAHIIANTDFGDINVAIDAEFKKVSDSIYVLINKFPSFFVDISKLKGKWIKFTPNDLASYGSLYFGSSAESTEEEITKTKTKSVEQFKLFLSIADRNKALISNGKHAKESIGGVSAYRYDLEFNKESFAQFYGDLTTEFKNKYPDDKLLKFDQATLDYLNSPEFDKTFEYFRKNTTLTLWADAQGIPIQLEYSLRIVPESNKKNVDNQIRLVATLALSDINKTTVVSAPENALTMEDATIAMTGQSKEQYRFDKQVAAISSIRYALESYKRINKVYPNNLEELTRTKASYGNSMIMKSIPKDIYDNNDFLYSNRGTDFSLMYNVILPSYTTGDSVRGIYEYNYSNSKSPLGMKAVNGQNTANSKHASEEASVQAQKDTDGDKISDAMEKYIGTNISKKDTDGDGHSDYDEVIGDSNPLGPGKLKSNRGGGFSY
jgi:hypothetical protein